MGLLLYAALLLTVQLHIRGDCVLVLSTPQCLASQSVNSDAPLIECLQPLTVHSRTEGSQMHTFYPPFAGEKNKAPGG